MWRWFDNILEPTLQIESSLLIMDYIVLVFISSSCFVLFYSLSISLSIILILILSIYLICFLYAFLSSLFPLFEFDNMLSIDWMAFFFSCFSIPMLIKEISPKMCKLRIMCRHFQWRNRKTIQIPKNVYIYLSILSDFSFFLWK